MCQGIDAIGIKLLTCIYDLKTQNPHASFCYLILNSFAMVLEKLANLLIISDLDHEKLVLKMLEGQPYPGIKNNNIVAVYKDVLGAQNISKALQGDGFLWPRILFFPIMEEYD